METSIFELNENEEQVINYRIIVALFKSMYKENDFTKKEYELLLNSLKRTFNII